MARQGDGRYGSHDLLRAYAIELSSASAGLPERELALSRLLRWYLHSATAAAKVINSQRRHVQLPAPDTEPMAFAGYDEGLAWLDAERASLIACVALAAELGEHELAWKLPLTLWDLFSLRGLFDDWIAAHRVALVSARLCAEPVGQSWVLNNLGAAYMLLDELPAALDCYRQILPLRGGLNDKRIEASLFHNLGLLAAKTGEFDTAMTELGTALTLYRESGDRYGEGQTLNTIADTLCLRGLPAESLGFYQQAVDVFTQTGNQFGESVVLTDLGQARLELGDAELAIDCCSRALMLSREVGHLPGQARALQVLGDAMARCGKEVQAREHWLLAVAIYTQLGDPRAAGVRAQLVSLWLDAPAARPVASLRPPSGPTLEEKHKRCVAPAAGTDEADGSLLLPHPFGISTALSGCPGRGEGSMKSYRQSFRRIGGQAWGSPATLAPGLEPAAGVAQRWLASAAAAACHNQHAVVYLVDIAVLVDGLMAGIYADQIATARRGRCPGTGI